MIDESLKIGMTIVNVVLLLLLFLLDTGRSPKIGSDWYLRLKGWGWACEDLVDQRGRLRALPKYGLAGVLLAVTVWFWVV